MTSRGYEGLFAFTVIALISITDTVAAELWRGSLMLWPYWMGWIDMSQAEAVMQWHLVSLKR